MATRPTERDQNHPCFPITAACSCVTLLQIGLWDWVSPCFYSMVSDKSNLFLSIFCGILVVNQCKCLGRRHMKNLHLWYLVPRCEKQKLQDSYEITKGILHVPTWLQGSMAIASCSGSGWSSFGWTSFCDSLWNCICTEVVELHTHGWNTFNNMLYTVQGIATAQLVFITLSHSLKQSLMLWIR